jgi:hypothetical protein
MYTTLINPIKYEIVTPDVTKSQLFMLKLSALASPGKTTAGVPIKDNCRQLYLVCTELAAGPRFT